MEGNQRSRPEATPGQLVPSCPPNRLPFLCRSQMSEMSVKCGVFCVSAGYRHAFVAAIDPAWGRSAERERQLFPGFLGSRSPGAWSATNRFAEKLSR